MAAPFRAAVFDMDGLLIDSERAIMAAWIDGAQSLGIALSAEDFGQVIGRAGGESRGLLVEMLGGEPAYAATQAHARAALHAGGQAPVFPLKPGAAALLAALGDAGIPCAVASSSSVAEIRHRLAAVDVLRHFAAVAGGDEVARGKPDPAIYRLATARLGRPPADCIAFEDSENGARAALAAGIRVVIVPDLRHPPAELAERAHEVLPSLEHALPRLASWFAGAP